MLTNFVPDMTFVHNIWQKFASYLDKLLAAAAVGAGWSPNEGAHVHLPKPSQGPHLMQPICLDTAVGAVHCAAQIRKDQMRNTLIYFRKYKQKGMISFNALV